MMMDAFIADNKPSNMKKSVDNLEIERSSASISEPGLQNLTPSSIPVTNSETKSGIEMCEKGTPHLMPEVSTSLSKNSSKAVRSICSYSNKALYYSPHPRANSPTTSESTSGRAFRNKDKFDQLVEDVACTEKVSSSFASPGPLPSPHAKPPLYSEMTTGKASCDKEKLVAVSEDGFNSAQNSSSSLGLEIASNLTTTTSCIKPSDAKSSDGGTTTSQSSCGSPQRDSMDSSSSKNAPIKRHTGHDSCWEAIQLASSRDPPLGLGHFKLLKRLGYGDIGSVYLVELKDTGTYFAMKVMDKASLISRNKLVRAQTEREILSLLDHPFLPTLYSYFETEKFYCLVMEYCSGGNLHSLRQKQPNKHFTEQAARFYASQVLLALEYLHMLGIVYRDLKPENVLVREEGHIMLSDFDLSLRCSVNPTLVKSSSLQGGSSSELEGMIDTDRVMQGCIQPTAFFPRILPKRNRKSKSDFGLSTAKALPELMAEPTNARSMSFVGTHEYLAPEIIRGDGHGSAVDWWTFGIFIYELIYGTTPFRGSGNRATLYNVVGQPLRFPEEPAVSSSARDLIRGLLVKDPQRRIAHRRGATEIKQHPFFEGVSWALVRSMQPPHVPDPVDFGLFSSKDVNVRKKNALVENGGGMNKQNQTAHLYFEYF